MRNRIPPPLVMIIAGAVMWFVAENFVSLRLEIPYRAVISTTVIALGALMVISGIFRFARLKTTVNPFDLEASTRLATTGTYRLSRNPMYLGLAIMLLGWTIHLENPVNLLCIAAFVWFITAFQIRHEEEALRRLFGEEYEAYCRKVRRWI